MQADWFNTHARANPIEVANVLRLTQEQLDWVLAQQRTRLAQALSSTVQARWPQLAAQLGDRSAAFVDSALQQAQRHGFIHPTHAVRYVNLWCVWGPAFDDKPGFEWATDIVRDPRRSAAVKIQQLVLQSKDILKARPNPALGVEAFDAADAAMEAVIAQPGAMPWLEEGHQLMRVAEPRTACDLSSFDMAVGDQSWRHEYRLACTGQAILAQYAPMVPPAQRFRTDTPPLPGAPTQPRQVAVLADEPQRGHKAWLHLRCDMGEVCDPNKHPRLEIKSDQGVRVFEGQPARLVKWPLHSAPLTAEPLALCQELKPRHMLVTASSCGLRRTGAPLGQQDISLYVHPSAQWLAEFSPGAQPTLQWPSASAPDAPQPTRIKLMCDNRPQPAGVWEADWAKLVPQLTQGLEAWFNTVQRNEAFVQPRLLFQPQLMQGQTSWTWGACEAVTSSGSTGFLRVAAFVRMVACASVAEWQMDFRHAGAHARMYLQATGRAPLTCDVLREAPEPTLAKCLSEVKAQWRFPWVARIEALSSPQLATLAWDDRSQLGALVGEAGLRPRPDGKGWQWYCQLKLEPAALTLALSDPLLGGSTVTQTLWPALVLLDWSAG